MTPEQRLRRAIEAAVARLRESIVDVQCPESGEEWREVSPDAVEAIAADLEHAARNNEGG